MEHASKCFARLVRVLLGTSAVADEQCEVGDSGAGRRSPDVTEGVQFQARRRQGLEISAGVLL